MCVPQRLPGLALADFVLLQVILARAFEASSITTRHNVDFIFAQQPLDTDRCGGLSLDHLDAHPVPFGVEPLAGLFEFRNQARRLVDAVRTDLHQMPGTLGKLVGFVLEQLFDFHRDSARFFRGRFGLQDETLHPVELRPGLGHLCVQRRGYYGRAVAFGLNPLDPDPGRFFVKGSDHIAGQGGLHIQQYRLSRSRWTYLANDGAAKACLDHPFTRCRCGP
ncbi:hypothetical protein D3C81_1522520 [compost metagenome]